MKTKNDVKKSKLKQGRNGEEENRRNRRKEKEIKRI